MKKVILSILVITICSLNALAQDAKTQQVKIQTSAQCFMCKERIEKDFAFEKGVSDTDLNLDNMVLTVTYNPKKTNEAKIRKRVTLIGYDADDLMADLKAYNKLPRCCQKGGHPKDGDKHTPKEKEDNHGNK